MDLFSTSPVISLYCSASKANYTYHSPTHWYWRHHWYCSLCPDRQGLIEWWAGFTIPGFYAMVNTSATGDIYVTSS